MKDKEREVRKVAIRAMLGGGGERGGCTLYSVQPKSWSSLLIFVSLQELEGSLLLFCFVYYPQGLARGGDSF
jgi:hypothetical protein